MRVAIAVHHLPPRYRGGAENRALRTARELIARGHDVRTICVEEAHSGAPGALTWQDDRYEGVPVRRLSYDMALTPDPFRFEYDNTWIGDHLCEWFAQWRPDVFHLFSGYLMSGRALRVANEAEVPSIVSLTDYWFMCRRINLLRSNGELSTLPIDPARCARCVAEERRRYRIPGNLAPSLMDAWWRGQRAEVARFAERQAFLLESLAMASRIVCPSEFLRDVYVEWGAAPEKMVYARQGSRFAAPDPARSVKTTSSLLRLGYIGQVAPHKGVHVILEALRRIPTAQVQLAIYGDMTQFPDYVAKLRGMAAADPRCVFKGPFTADHLGDVMREIDVLVVPSLWYENSPNVIIEACGHGSPTIVSDLGGMAELVEEERSGLRFPMGDADALAAAITRIADEPGLLATLRESALAQRFPTLSEEIDALEAVYREALDGQAAELAVDPELVAA